MGDTGWEEGRFRSVAVAAAGAAGSIYQLLFRNVSFHNLALRRISSDRVFTHGRNRGKTWRKTTLPLQIGLCEFSFGEFDVQNLDGG